MTIYEKIALGEVDYASWRKRKDMRDDRREQMGIVTTKERKMKRAKQRHNSVRDIDPSSDPNYKVQHTPMANLH